MNKCLQSRGREGAGKTIPFHTAQQHRAHHTISARFGVQFGLKRDTPRDHCCAVSLHRMRNRSAELRVPRSRWVRRTYRDRTHDRSAHNHTSCMSQDGVPGMCQKLAAWNWRRTSSQASGAIFIAVRAPQKRMVRSARPTRPARLIHRLV